MLASWDVPGSMLIVTVNAQADQLDAEPLGKLAIGIVEDRGLIIRRISNDKSPRV